MASNAPGTEVFIRRTRIEAPAAEVFAWHARPSALEDLTPPWEKVKVVERTRGLENGSRVILETRMGPFHVKWVSEHCDYEEGRSFTDVQIEGPFAYWKHLHKFEADGANACYLEDRIEYALPFGVVGKLLGGRLVRKKLERLFEYRHMVTAREIAALRG